MVWARNCERTNERLQSRLRDEREAKWKEKLKLNVATNPICVARRTFLLELRFFLPCTLTIVECSNVPMFACFSDVCERESELDFSALTLPSSSKVDGCSTLLGWAFVHRKPIFAELIPALDNTHHELSRRAIEIWKIDKVLKWKRRVKPIVFANRNPNLISTFYSIDHHTVYRITISYSCHLLINIYILLTKLINHYAKFSTTKLNTN